MRIAFFDNGNLSLLFGVISNNLNTVGVESFLLTLSKRKKTFLEGKGIKNVIYINVEQGNETEGNKLIKDIENNIDEFRLYRGIELDRVLKNKKNKFLREFLFRFADIAFNILEQKKIDIVFGEVTWAIEYITYFLMEYRGKKYFNPKNNYIVPGRFAFLDYKDSPSFIKKRFSEEDLEKAKNIYTARKNVDINKQAKFLQTYIPSNFKERLSNFFHSFSTEDYRYSVFLKKKLILKYINRVIINNFFRDFKDLSFLKENQNRYRYAVLNLHIQPEATPDVVSTYYNDQYRLIKVIRASLPENYILLVKEHPNGIGSRNINWLKRVKSLPGVFLINPNIPMIKLFNYIDIVFSIAGTVAFESSLHKIPAIIFSDTFLQIFPMVEIEKNFDNLTRTIKKQLNRKNYLDEERIEAQNIESIAKIYSNTYEGNIYDPLQNPKVLSNSNIQLVLNAFKNFIEDYE